MAYKFKIGDKVRVLHNGMVGEIKNLFWNNNIGGYSEIILDNNNHSFYYCNENLALVEENLITNKSKTNLMKLNTMMKKLLDANTKKLIKAGLIDGNLLLTEQGKEALQAIEVEKNKKELLEMADEIIAEEEKK